MEKQVKYSCIKELKEPGAPIIIVSLATEAEAIANACRDNNIDVAAFCDNERRKLNKPYWGLEVIHTPDLPKRFPKARLIIAHYNLQDRVDELADLGYNEFYSPLELFRSYNVNKHQHLQEPIISQSYMENKISICKKSHELYFDDSKTHLRSLDIMITTKCSMKCESCANLMQYYTDAKNTDHQIVSAVETISSNVDAISEFRIIGGEPLMNKDWANIVNGIIKKDKNRNIFIYTNGTINPKDEQLESFKGMSVQFYITDYGKQSRNIDKLEANLKKHKINYMRKPADYWVDCSSIRQHNRTAKENTTVFKECCAKKLFTLLNGKLYSCPFIANAGNLKAIPNNPANYVDLSDNNNDLKQKIRRLVKMEKFFPACDFCDGRPTDPKSAKVYDGSGMITPALQTPNKKPISYTKYK